MKNSKPFFADRATVRPSQLTSPAFRKVREALESLDRAGVIYEATCESRRADTVSSVWNAHHVFVTVSEQANRQWPENTIGRIGAAQFCLSFHVMDAEPGSRMRSGSKFQFCHRMGWMCDKRYRKLSEALLAIKCCCSKL